MKKLLSLIALILVFTCVFVGCKKDDDNLGEDYVVDEYYYDEELANPPLEENVFSNVYDLVDFFKIESVEELGPQFGLLFNMVLGDNFVFCPLISGEDVSQKADYARIEVNPPEKEGDYSHIAYYYTNGAYNYVIKVYYLDEGEYSVAMIDGYNALNNGDPDVVSKEKYGQYTIVTNLPDQTTYAELSLKEKYFITITGASINNDQFPGIIEKEALDLLSFDEIQVSDMM